MPRPPSPDHLAAYRAKRSLERTPEPAGAVGPTSGRLFVVHMHAATRLHWDLRLEMEGVLRSWAVPKGPSYDTADKRLAVHVEDHPIEYGDFEGLIPEGNYGAGAVIVWDRGEWVPIGDPLEGLEKGKLLFELKGYKLHGLWTLVKIKKGEKEWLLIKERDGWASTDRATSARVGAVGAHGRGSRGGPRLAARPSAPSSSKLGAPRRPVEAEIGESDARGDRGAGRSPGRGGCSSPSSTATGSSPHGGAARPRLFTRNGNECAEAFPEVARAVAALPFDRLVLDGEVVALDDHGIPSFQRLQGRARLRRPIDIRHAAVETPVTYYAFDLLGLRGLRSASAAAHRAQSLLQRVLPPLGALRYLEHVEDDGEALYREAERLGLEGVVAKKATAPYKAGRSSVWLKIRSRLTGDFVVVGSTAPKGSRGGFGALHLAEYVDGTLTYSGRVGTGFTEKQLAEVTRSLERDRRADPPCVGPVPKEKGTTWVEPRARVRGRVHRMDRGRAAATAGVPEVPRRQAAGRVYQARSEGRAVGRSRMAPGRTTRGARTMAAGWRRWPRGGRQASGAG